MVFLSLTLTTVHPSKGRDLRLSRSQRRSEVTWKICALCDSEQISLIHPKPGAGGTGEHLQATGEGGGDLGKIKLNISFPDTGCQKLIEVGDERKQRSFYEKRMATEVAANALGEEWKGDVVQIRDENGKQGFPMKQGVLTHGCVCLLLSKGHSCHRPRRTGERKHKSGPAHKSARVCTVDTKLSILHLVIVNKGEKDITGLTDTTVPHRLGPRRTSRIRKLFSLSKEDNVHQYVGRKPLHKEGKKPRTKAPKIQHLVTPRVLQHQRRRIAPKKQRTQQNKEEAAEYAQLLAKRLKRAKEKRQEQIAKRCRLSSLRASTCKSESSQK
ncbi:40S ribosomal protein S6-like [Tupaia chinensis]|uniref:40S ribosomal protein S6-like n=1 Tax=Tupaia chinensis TaxID=246437 RepID=UPI000703E783|nr:40S ribosomal protein S6-like [Tupaia chinensis]